MAELHHFVFVYGTLQRGENNYAYWLADPTEAVFVARSRTVSRYPLFVNLPPDFPGCSPCLLDLPDCDVSGCERVDGELFLVSNKMKAWLDVLENTAGGTYVAAPAPVEVCESPTASFRARGGPASDALVWSPPSPAVATAAIYFRAKSYPADWASANPRSSTTLMAKFSAAGVLRQYGARFSGGVPAHLRPDGDFAETTTMQAELNALPPQYWPPSTLAYHAAARESAQAAGGSGAAAPAARCHGAPLFPAPLVLFIIDGIGDNTYAELGGRTPLEVVAGVPVASNGAAAASVTAPSPSREQSAPGSGRATGGAATPALRVTESVLAGSDAAALRQTSGAHVSSGINVVTRHGVSGLMDPYMAGKSCGSDTAHLSMFGYPPTTYYRGRGAYEALGAGLELDDEDVAFKSNFATFADPGEELFGDEDGVAEARAVASTAVTDQHVTHRRCDRDFTVEGPVLCNDLNGLTVATDLSGAPFDYPHVIKMQYATEHRCGVALSGARYTVRADGTTGVLGMLSDKITGTDPLKDGRLLLHCKPTVSESHPEYAAACYTCRLVEAASAALSRGLKAHPVNVARRQHNRAVTSGAPAAANASDDEGVAKLAAGARKNVANLVLFRGAAKKGWVPTFAVRHGLHGLILAPTCIIKGLGICCGLRGDVCRACDPTGGASLRGATGDYHSDLMVKVQAALHAMRVACPPSHAAATTAALQRASTQHAAHLIDAHFNFVVVHVKGVDDAGHDKSLRQKLEMLRRSGLAMDALWTGLPPGSTMAVIADHSTPLGIGDHCCEPVPVSMAVKGGTAPGAVTGPLDGVEYYSEVLAASGALGRFRGDELIALMKRLHHHYHYA